MKKVLWGRGLVYKVLNVLYEMAAFHITVGARRLDTSREILNKWEATVDEKDACFEWTKSTADVKGSWKGSVNKVQRTWN